MADVLKLTFLTSANNVGGINISYPNRNLSDAQVAAAMERIIDTGALSLNNSLPVKSIGAELQTLDETPYSL